MVWMAILWGSLSTVHGAEFFTQIRATPSPAILNQTVAFSINITNVSSTDFRGMLLTNTLPNASGLQSATTTLGTVNTSSVGSVVVNIGALPAGQAVVITMSFLVSGSSPLTNQLSVSATSATNSLEVDSFTASLVTTVVSGTSDLGVQLQGPTQFILPGDQIAYTIGVTNGGPNAALSPVVVISIPGGLTFGSLLPTNITYSLTNQTVTAILTNSGPNTQEGFILHVQAASAGRAFLYVSVSAPGNVDPVSSNNASLLAITIDSPPTNALVVSPNSAQRFNPQTGAMEQSVRVTNPGLSSISGFRIAAPGVTNALLEAVGTNYSVPFAAYPGTLEPGGAVDLLLSFFVPSRQPLNSLVYLATAEGSSLAPIPTGTAVALDAAVWQKTNGFLLEFPSTVGQVYSVVYGSDAAFTDATVSQPPIIATASRTQWIDTGPPRTLSHPVNNAYRFYKVIQVP